MRVAPMPSKTLVHDHVALDEIELCGELIIAASAAVGERLSADRIDEVLRVAPRAVPRTGRDGSVQTSAWRPRP
ncbi:hypothetical protein DSC45_23425 [Streptomyces sp. YIM 130001]|uniref:hypothetical protein n=1 Tax=Streptomyces sp. YIM 130001 TaxID=2259644 RepID=UPI000ECF613A|nr:hypothetical protein [Streptomyces sp. YIM 130001]RII13515.1 hypothetical protein DSC45_23425 [Streptomyces sp. YIM 130001]